VKFYFLLDELIFFCKDMCREREKEYAKEVMPVSLANRPGQLAAKWLCSV
jgi:hypothetical protein